MTNERLQEIEAKCDREDIPLLIAYIRHLQTLLMECKEVLIK